MKRQLAVLVVMAIIGVLGASVAQATESNYSGWSLPAWLGNSINAANYTTTAGESHTQIKTSSNSTKSDFRVRNIKCSTTDAVTTYVDYSGTATAYKVVGTNVKTGTCIRYQAGAYGLGGTTISGKFKY